MADQNTLQDPSTGGSKLDARSRDIASEAFSSAIESLKEQFREDARTSKWLQECATTTLESLLEVTGQAEEQYTQLAKTNGKLMRFVRGLSSRVMIYGKVFDTLAQHHPEFVSLIWGLTKFVLMGIINHANLVNHFSQALTLIADVLPTVHISADLYQTDRMRDAVANLYAQVLLFLRQAVKWYQMGPAGRALAALFKPFELSYKDTVESIRGCAQSISQIASISAKAETREINQIIQRVDKQGETLLEMHQRFTRRQAELDDKVSTILQVISRDTHKLNEIHVDVKSMHPLVVDTHLKQVLDSIYLRRCPRRDLQKHRSLIRRASPWRNNRVGHNTVNVFKTITGWISVSTSSLVVLRTQARAHSRVKEIATELIGHLQPGSKPVVWYLSSFGAEENNNPACATTVDIIKSLISQSMSTNPKFVLADPGNFNVAKLKAHHSFAEWLGLLVHLLQSIRDLFVIIEADDVFQNEEEAGSLDQLFEAFADVVHGPDSSVKVLIVTYGKQCQLSRTNQTRSRVKVIDVEREAPVPPRLRKAGNRSVFGKRFGAA